MCWKHKRGKRMSDKKEKTKTKNKKEKPDTILINIMYTGDYTNKNIGHEIINLYKTDNGENYIYISPYGKIHKDRYDKVKTVLLARPAGKNRLEIIAKAENLKSFDNKKWQEEKTELNSEADLQEFIGKKEKDTTNNYKYFLEQILEDNNLFGLNKNVAKIKLYIDWFIKNKKGLKTISDKFIMSRKIVTQEQIRNIQFEFIWQQLKNNIEIIDKKEVTAKKIEFIDNFNNNVTIYLDDLKEKFKNELNNELKYEELEKKFEKLSQYADVYNELNENGTKLQDEKDEIKKYFVKNANIALDWTKRRALHNYQIDFINDEDNAKDKHKPIKYDKKLLHEIIKDNKWDDVNAHFTFRAGTVLRPKKSIFIEYTSPKNNEDDDQTSSKQNEKTGSVTQQEIKAAKIGKSIYTNTSRTYKFENIKFRNQSCMKYLVDGKNDFIRELKKIQKKYKNNDIYNELNNIVTNLSENNGYFDSQQKKLLAEIKKIFKNNKNEDFIKLKNILDSQEPKIYKYFCENIINNNEIWKKKEDSTKTVEYDDDTNDYEPFFLDITGNQYDELSYSNMFAYFFKKEPELFEEFANEVLKVKNVKTTNTFEVIREENNIDILIETENDIFIIENKVKSHINGEKYIDTEDAQDKKDSDNEDKKDKSIEYTNQLIKYYNYVESKYPDKNRHYFIFKPTYNDIKAELDAKIEEIKASKDITNTINKYHHINYSDIYDFYIEKPQKPQNTDDEQALIDYVYFKDFIKALKRHINSTDNTNELIMKYKFKQAIAIAKASKPK